MTSQDVRRTFLSFFEARGHRVVPSSPLVLPGDATLLFVNAGMVQFKDVFTGKDRREYRRAATSQKCMRVSGKHNDLEMVGRTPRHHTFFEMLGNFSFGDYFKEEAARYAWELLTGEFGIPAERLWVTVFGGSDAFPADDEARALWKERVGVPEERILALGEKDNFWRMGDTGPCGPCTELHVDLGEDLTSVEGPSDPSTDERRFMEVWNLVFMQFDQRADGTTERLPAPSVDTGMGLERITSVLQGKRSNYDTDLFQPIIAATAALAGATYGDDAEKDVSLRVVADHVRALAFLVADGVIPANDNRGYVVRRILRRAIRHGRKLGIERPFLHEVTPVVLDILGDAYPEIRAADEALDAVTGREERQFAETLSTGIELLDRALDEAPEVDGRRKLPGEELFRLYDTYGLPLDLARDIADERGFDLDEAGFDQAMEGQRSRARASWKGSSAAGADGAYDELVDAVTTRFEGYDTTALEDVRVEAALRDGKPVDRLAEGEEGEILLDTTPFYAESGGQVGDTGTIRSGGAVLSVLDTQRPAPGLIVSRVRVDNGAVAVGDRVSCEVDVDRRRAIARNHTATHLLHAALRDLVGTHVKQAGSRVAPERLRFDFSHFSGLSDEALSDVEGLVNDQVLAGTPVTTETMPIDEALSRRAMALFGERYGDAVRVVGIGDFSLELCGGIHVGTSAEVGLFKLTQERGVASGVRRVEAVTGTGSLDVLRESTGFLRALEGALSVPRDEVVGEVARRLDRIRELERELEGHRIARVRAELEERLADPEVVAGIRVVSGRVDGLGAKEAREVADGLRRKLGSGVVLLGRDQGGKASLLAAVSDDLTDRVPAGDLVRTMARVVGGGGGGRKDLAEAGGKDATRLDEALAAGRDRIRESIDAG